VDGHDPVVASLAGVLPMSDPLRSIGGDFPRSHPGEVPCA
jgi:hypothetical protein